MALTMVQGCCEKYAGVKARNTLFPGLDTQVALTTTLDHRKCHVCPRQFLAHISQYDKPVFPGELPHPSSGGEKFPSGIFSGRSGGKCLLLSSWPFINPGSGSLRRHFCPCWSPGVNGSQSASHCISHPRPHATLGSYLNLLLYPYRLAHAHPHQDSLASSPRRFIPRAYSRPHS